MAFIETPRFPDRIAMGAQGGPVFSTTVVTAASGRQFTDAAWQYPLHRWDVSQGLNDPTRYAELRAFFLAVAQGRANAWRFKDWTDYAATASDGRAIAIAGSTTTFQLVKRYTSGSSTLDRLISKPVSTGFAILVSGSPPTYSLNATTGIVTIAAAPAASAITWSGEFDVPCAFDTDALNGRAVGRNGQGLVMEWGEIPIVERPQ